MDIYIKEFLNNPAGKGSAVLNIKATKDKYQAKYDEICKQISHKTYIVGKKYYIVVEIPSSVKGIFYDVLLEFEPTKNSTGKSISDMKMRVFSNSPSFLYTFANAYNKQKIFIKECKGKLSTKMLSDIAKTRNPYGVLSYDFSVFAALFYIVNNGYTNITDLETLGIKKASMSGVLDNIKNADKLQKTRKEQKAANKLEEEELMKIKKDKIKHVSSKKPQEDKPDKIKEVGKVKNLHRIKSSRNVKKVKKI